MNSKIKVLIVYATWTGNTEEIANLLYNEFTSRNTEVGLYECQQVNASDFANVDICVVATYTFGRDGELPDEIYGFFDDLALIDLHGKVYGVLGSGDLYYDYYCKAVDEFDLQFRKTGAKKGTENLKIDTSANENDKINIAKFASELIATYQSIHNESN